MGERQVRMEAEIEGYVKSQGMDAKDCQWPPEGSRKRGTQQILQHKTTLQHPDFRCVASRTVREEIYFKPLSLR